MKRRQGLFYSLFRILCDILKEGMLNGRIIMCGDDWWTNVCFDSCVNRNILFDCFHGNELFVRIR